MFMSTFIPEEEIKDYCKPSKENLFDDNCLKKLFERLKSDFNYEKIITPRWKNFSFHFSDKTRVNNTIWRSWHIQFVNDKKPLFCIFYPPSRLSASYRALQSLNLEVYRNQHTPIHYDPSFKICERDLPKINKRVTTNQQSINSAQTIQQNNNAFSTSELSALYPDIFLQRTVEINPSLTETDFSNSFDWTSFLQPDLSQLLQRIDTEPLIDASYDLFWSNNLGNNSSIIVEPSKQPEIISLDSRLDFLPESIEIEKSEKPVVTASKKSAKSLSSDEKKRKNMPKPRVSKLLKSMPQKVPHICPRIDQTPSIDTEHFTTNQLETNINIILTIDNPSKEKDLHKDSIKKKELHTIEELKNDKRRRVLINILLDELYVQLEGSSVLDGTKNFQKRPSTISILSRVITRVRHLRSQITQLNFSNNELKKKISKKESDLNSFKTKNRNDHAPSFCINFYQNRLHIIKNRICSDYKYWIFYIIFQSLWENLAIIKGEKNLNFNDDKDFQYWFKSTFNIQQVRAHIFNELRRIALNSCIVEKPQIFPQQAKDAAKFMDDPTKISGLPPEVSKYNGKNFD